MDLLKRTTLSNGIIHGDDSREIMGNALIRPVNNATIKQRVKITESI